MNILKYINFYKVIISLIILFNVVFIAPFAYIETASALNLKDAFKFNADGNTDPTDSVASNAGYKTTSTVSLLAVISTIIDVVLSLLGVIFLVLIIYAGFNWMTAAGEEDKITKSKSTITAAIIGLIVVLAAYAISYFVIYQISSAVLKQTP
ncbi:MAG: hypothetical protein AAB530_00910 [Patescibacteria group bacterium]